MGYLTSEVVQSGGIPMHLVSAIIVKVDVPVLIELGSAGGESIKKVAKLFKECHTVEIVEERCMPDYSLKNVWWHTCSSVEILPAIIENLIKEKQSGVPRYAMFFIDSHYSGDVEIKGEECPLMEELEIISGYNEDAILIIDDARLFLGHPPFPLDPRKWPSIQEIFALLNEKFPNNVNTICDDYILSFPDRIRDCMDEEWRRNFTKRYPSAKDKLKSETKNVWEAFQNYLKS